MRIRAAGVLIKDGELLVIHREKVINGMLDEYYVIPGGGIENGESLIDATMREMYEEVGICVEVLNEKPIYQIKNDDSEQNFMLVKYKSGKVGTGTGPEYNDEKYKTRGSYFPEFVKLLDIANGKINLVPIEFKNFVLEYIANTENN